MVITYFGNGSFRLQSGDISLLLNPENNRLKADVTLRTLAGVGTSELLDHSADTGITISFPGEYESHGIEITGFPIAEESTEKFIKTTYKILFEDMMIVFLGHLSRPLDATLMEEFSEPDVLVLPVGGGHFLEPEIAAKMAKQLEARVVIPCFTKSTDAFLKALGRKTDAIEKLVFRQKDILAEKGRPVILKEAR